MNRFLRRSSSLLVTGKHHQLEIDTQRYEVQRTVGALLHVVHKLRCCAQFPTLALALQGYKVDAADVIGPWWRVFRGVVRG